MLPMFAFDLAQFRITVDKELAKALKFETAFEQGVL